MKVEAEPCETGAGRGRALIMLALKRTIVLELCPFEGFFIRE